MISVVAIYNNEKLLNDYLIKNLNNQSVEYELILIDNTPQKLNSAAEALNNAAENAKGKYIMFTHYDISFSDTWLEEIEIMLEKIDNLGIAGVAGIEEKGKQIISNIEDGIPPEHMGKQIKSPQEVFTLDEVVAIIPKHIFNKFKFDEEIGGWHLYVVDYCLNIKKQGLGVFVLPVSLHHRSRPPYLPEDYFIVLKKLLEKYRNDYDKLYTTCGNWDRTIPLILHKINRYYKPKLIKSYLNKNPSWNKLRYQTRRKDF